MVRTADRTLNVCFILLLILDYRCGQRTECKITPKPIFVWKGLNDLTFKTKPILNATFLELCLLTIVEIARKSQRDAE